MHYDKIDLMRIAWNQGITRYRPKPCACSCGELVQLHKYPKKDGSGFAYSTNKFIKGHNKRGVDGFDSSTHAVKFCACGCGLTTNKTGSRYNRFIKGHENRGRAPWNKGGLFSAEVRYKMRLARLGKEPANKASIGIDKLYHLYVNERKNIRQVSQELGIAYDSIKNRLRALGWSRSTKESCSSPAFKEQMRRIRIKTLTSKPFVESPNKLERAVYDALDGLGVTYQKQAPLFNKFVVDVLFPQNNLVLEIFGRYWHEMPINRKKDFSKKKYLLKCGYKVAEVWDDEIKKAGVVPILQSVLNMYDLWPE